MASNQAAIPAKQTALEEKLAERLDVERQLADMRRQLGGTETEIRTLTGRRAEAERNAEKVGGRLQEVRVERERLAANHDNPAHAARGDRHRPARSTERPAGRRH